MSDNPYDHMLKPGPFEKAVDKAIAEENQRYASWSAQEQADINEMVERYAHLEAAQEAAGGYGVVLPVELARAILAGLRNEDTALSLLSSDLPERMLRAAIDKADAKGSS